MDPASRQRDRPSPDRSPVQPRSIVQLIADGDLDAELGALLWLLVEGRLPLVVAGPSLTGRTTLLAALLNFLPSGTRRRRLAGPGGEFAWLPEAAALGWRPTGSPGAPSLTDPASPAISAGEDDVRPATTYLLAGELGGRGRTGARGEPARIAVRATSVGYGLGATVAAGSLEEVLARLRRPDLGLSDDEASHLGVVLVARLAEGADGGLRRIAAAHYLRPLARDQGGHLRRRAPAVLATWDERRDAFEHFAWGIVPELAERVGCRAGDFESEQARRAEYLTVLAGAAIVDAEAVRSALAGYVPRGAPVHRH